MERKRIFRESRYSPRIGICFLFLGITLYCLSSLSQNDRLTLMVFAIVVVWSAGFVFCYGMRPSRAAIFPLCFLLLMIPIPAVLLDKAVLGLQKGSSAVTYALFKLVGVPVFLQGFRFSLPGVDIEIAKECSGIRSNLALFITGTLAGHVFLGSGWRKVILSLSTIPIAIFKNAVRIVTISSLGVYVDRGFLYGRLHRQGGLLFAVIALAMFVPLLFTLQKSEIRSQEAQLASSEQSCIEGTGL
jgi:exosortase